MGFARPWILVLLGFIPLLFLYRRRLQSSSVRFSYTTVASQIKPTVWLHYLSLLRLLRWLSILLIVLALAGPRVSQGKHRMTTEGIDIILVLDISGSMQAEDFKPRNRLEAAKNVAIEFLSGRTNDRIGLVVFAGQALLQCPLTLDRDILTQLVDEVEMGMIQDGTAIGTAIITTVSHLKDSKARSRIAILLTDGINQGGEIDPVTAAKAAAASDIKMYTIGVGSEEGAPIPVVDPIRGKTYARDRRGQIIYTKLDEGTLRQIAQMTKARYFRATDERSLSAIYDEISRLETSEIELTEYTRYKQLELYSLFPVALFLLLEWILTHTRLRKLP